MRVAQIITAINAATATATSAKIYIGEYARVAILLRRAADAGGTSAFTVKGGFAALPGDDPAMTALNTLIDNVTNTNANGFTRINGTSIAASNGDKFIWLSPETPVTHLEITVTETGDGTHSAYVIGFDD